MRLRGALPPEAHSVLRLQRGEGRPGLSQRQRQDSSLSPGLAVLGSSSIPDSYSDFKTSDQLWKIRAELKHPRPLYSVQYTGRAGTYVLGDIPKTFPPEEKRLETKQDKGVTNRPCRLLVTACYIAATPRVRPGGLWPVPRSCPPRCCQGGSRGPPRPR